MWGEMAKLILHLISLINSNYIFGPPKKVLFWNLFLGWRVAKQAKVWFNGTIIRAIPGSIPSKGKSHCKIRTEQSLCKMTIRSKMINHIICKEQRFGGRTTASWCRGQGLESSHRPNFVIYIFTLTVYYSDELASTFPPTKMWVICLLRLRRHASALRKQCGQIGLLLKSLGDSFQISPNLGQLFGIF